MTARKPVTLETLITRRAQEASRDFNEAKDEFANAFAKDPIHTIEWKAEPVVKAQVRLDWWNRLLARINAGEGDAAVAVAKEEACNEVEHFFGTNSTCPYRTALQRTKAEAYNNLLRRSVPELVSVSAIVAESMK